jgi:hypothetical protein
VPGATSATASTGSGPRARLLGGQLSPERRAAPCACPPATSKIMALPSGGW